MAKPRKCDWAPLKRVARYLVGAPRFTQLFEWQESPSQLTAFADSDWAGERETRKSTSGGLVMWGLHVLKSWSSTQQVIALSSGEAELYALIKAAAQVKGLMSVMLDFDRTLNCTVCTDASAAMGMVHRVGLGRTRHIDVQYLWVQREVNEKNIEVTKIGTHVNPADVLTKNLAAEVMSRHLDRMRCERSRGRAATAPRLALVENSDYWAGKGNSWQRVHCKPRKTLLTPMKVAGGPALSTEVGRFRMTTGIYEGGEHLQKLEDWRQLENQHAEMPRHWVGRTLFLESHKS